MKNEWLPKGVEKYPSKKNNIGRKEFLSKLMQLGGTILAGKVGYDWAKEIYKGNLEQKIYYELPKYVHLVTISGSLNLEGKTKEIPIKKAMGIILHNKFLTMAHLQVSEEKKMLYEQKGLTNIRTMLYEKELKKIISDSSKEIAIYEIDSTLKKDLLDFPCPPKEEISIGEEIYLIGNPQTSGVNIRKGKISDINGYDGIEKGFNIMDKESFFGIDIPVIPGDSGCPVVNSKFELLGLCSFQFGGHLGYIKKISDYLKELNNIELNQKKSCKEK